MRNIIYCEDNREHIDLFIRDFCGEGSLLYYCNYNVTACRTPEELLKLAAKHPEIVLMDIDLNSEKNGIDMAEALYSISRSTQIIYVTAYTDKFIQDVFLRQANVCGFLNKPIQGSYLRKMINKAEKRAAENRTVSISSKNGFFTLPENDITYIESNKRRLTFHTCEKNKYEIYGSMSEYLERLSSSFVIAHQSFVVNKRYILGMKQKEIMLTDGTIIPISRSRLKDIRELLMNAAAAEAEENQQ